MGNNKEEESDGNQAKPIPELPEVIISDILSRLPVKTICRFRCICKSWHKLLLSDPYFAQLHLSRSPTTLIAKHLKNRELYMIEVHETTDILSTLGPLKMSPWFCQFTSKMKPISSCNGLILLTDYYSTSQHCDNLYKNYLVCNPIMGQYMNIPKPTNIGNGYYGRFGGFGFSSSTKQYKIMHLWTHEHTHDEVKIHTLGTPMWRSICGFVPKKLTYYSHDAYLNNALHWIDYTLDCVTVNCFDLGSERFERFPGPHSLENVCVLDLCLGVSGELLYIIDSFGSANLDVWIMKDYGVKESWTKVFVINPINIRCKCHIKERVKILNYGINSVLIMRCGAKYGQMPLVAYNLKSKCMREVHIGWFFFQSFEDQVLHVPSFVSLRDAVIDGETFQIDEFGCVSKPALCNVQIKQATPYLDALLSNIVPTSKG